RRFDDLYRPLLLTWLRRYSVRPQDADDLAQEVLEVVVREMPRFVYEPDKGTFRGWLRGILTNRLREFWRNERKRPVTTGDGEFINTILNQLESPSSELTRLWDQEHNEHVARRLLTIIEKDFSASTWAAFRRVLTGEK